MPQEIAMADAKAAAFFREFPFLEPHIRKTGLLQCQVKRVDQELLGKVISPCEAWQPDCYFFDREGNLIAKPGIFTDQAEEGLFKKKMVTKERKGSETIFDCLQRIGDTARKVHFIVIYDKNEIPKKLWVYKPPKALSVAEFMQAGMLIAKDELAQQIQGVDGVAKFCSECRLTSPVEAKFCRRCGKQLA
jgi:hypothetical protein